MRAASHGPAEPKYPFPSLWSKTEGGAEMRLTGAALQQLCVNDLEQPAFDRWVGRVGGAGWVCRGGCGGLEMASG